MTSVKVTTTKIAKKTKRQAFKISKEPYDVAVPKNFNFKDYKPLKKANFTEEHLYFEHRRWGALHQAEVFAAKAAESKLLGSAADRRAKKAVIKLQAKMAELRKTLEGTGVDVDALLKAAAEAQKAEAKTKK